MKEKISLVQIMFRGKSVIWRTKKKNVKIKMWWKFLAVIIAKKKFKKVNPNLL